MKEILFRGQRADNRKFVEGDVIHGVGSKLGKMYILPRLRIYPKDCNELDGYEVNPKTIGQLRYENKHGKYFDGDIYYCSGCGLDVVSELCEITDRLMHGDTDDIGEIKGNIHDDPELLS